MAIISDTKMDIAGGPDIPPGHLPAVPKGQKVGMDLQLYGGGVILPTIFREVVEYAQMMAKGGAAVPKHCRDQPGVCMSIIQRSLAWQMDPWAVATKTYLVGEILAYEAQLIAAVVQRWAPVRERVWAPVYEGEGLTRKCTITVHHRETDEVISYESPIIGPFVPGIDTEGKGKRAPDNFVGIWPKNSPLWRSDKDQALYYYTIRALSRRYFSGLLLGVYDLEEAIAARGQMRDITPKDNLLVDQADEAEEERNLNEHIARRAAEPPEGSGEHYGFAQELPQPGDTPAHDPETGEIDDETRQMTEDEVVAMMLERITAAADQQYLDHYIGLQHENILSLQPANQKRVRKAISDRSIDLEF